MIRRTVKARFRKIYWRPPSDLPAQCIFVCNHHGWHDGYLMFSPFQTATSEPRLDSGIRLFSLFAYAGGLPFPLGKPEVRAATIKKTIRLMNEEGRSLMLFGEGILHTPPEVWEIGKALDLVAKKVPKAAVIPVAIRYDMSIHERPEAYLDFGDPIKPSEARAVLTEMLENGSKKQFEVLFNGTLDVNERWDARRGKRRES